ncbi:zinc finger BED domain-containing protein RICESLEEPER 2-like [Cornus florida]|uniref:zinc finger BED domain-containing protein RICESLEEPER 2-like n=1 Tax=Cornus florida TaxID=4283 RepID=UPI0028A0057A|nr:zinc finger BED domain-containing protein RICESLEEPER 2-like [Cornus florida]
MCLTAHFIDENWKLHKRILNICVISSHKGEAIGQMIDACLTEWGIEKLCTLTIDNASSNDVDVDKLKTKFNKKCDSFILDGDFFHMRCSAHILNLIIKDGLSELKVSITRICGVVRYIRSSPQREKRFKHFVALEKITCKCSLCLDVPTRWNSTCMMLNVALKLQKAFESMEEEDRYFVKELDDGPPTKIDWYDALIFKDFLEKFYDATNRMAGSLYVTANVYFHEVCLIERELSECTKNLDPRLSAMAAKMKVKFDKYWGSIKKVNIMLVVAVVLDPRFKLNYVSYCYS